MEPGITIATDQCVADLVGTAQKDLVILAPAVTERVADAVADRWRALGPSAVQVIVDSDPEVYRLGFGDEKGLQILERVAREVGALLRKQSGTRIAIVVADGKTLIYTPPPRLIEAGPNTAGAANAIFLGQPPPQVSTDLGQGAAAPKVGKAELTAADTEQIQTSLKENPPQKFDIARRMNIFNAYLEFVELELTGVHIDRKRIQIPKHLMGVADQKTRDQISSHFRVVADGSALSGDTLRNDRELLARRFLRVIPNYGTVVKRSEKGKFIEEIEKLRNAVSAFREKLQAELQKSIDRSRQELVRALLPGVQRNPPSEWRFSDGRKPDKETCRMFIEEELAQAFGSAERLLSGMTVKLQFKGVTYEMLTDPEFLAAAAKAGVGMEKLHEEFQAAKAVEPQQLLDLT
jgi:hypothetical protein